MPLRPQGSLKPREMFGLVLRKLRREKGYSQEAFAYKTGFHRNYIGQLERGEKSPSLSALFTFADAFELQPSQILRRVERQVASRS